MRIVVSNSSPLILLAKSGFLSLLKEMFGTIIISEAVFHEVVVDGKGRPGAKEIGEADWIHTVEIKNRSSLESYTKMLEPGDATVIALAKEKNATLVIADDQEIRAVAQKEEIPVTGTAGILVLAKEEGLISSVQEALDRAKNQGLRISKQIYKEVLSEAGE
jgi:predicted nucleic acid-binding protein